MVEPLSEYSVMLSMQLQKFNPYRHLSAEGPPEGAHARGGLKEHAGAT